GLSQLNNRLTEIANDQQRLRANLKEMPSTAAAYKRYLQKFDDQETAIEKLQAQIQELQGRDDKLQRECDAYVDGLDVEATVRKAPPPARPSADYLRHQPVWIPAPPPPA